MGYTQQDVKIAEMMAKCIFDPLLHVVVSYPWNKNPVIQKVPWNITDGVPHPDTPVPAKYLKRFPYLRYGPDKWQCEELEVIGREAKKRADGGGVLKMSVVSGHNIGKSTMSAWLVKWILDTRPHSVGTVTANTATQLRNKTWAEVGKWHHMSLTEDWFRYVASATTMSLIYDKDQKLGTYWKCSAQTCNPENSEAFAGQQSDATSFYIFDEACHDGRTQVMTGRGWKYFPDVTGQDRLLTPDGWQTPQHIHVSHRKGKMIEIKKRGVSVRVTPGHEMYGKLQHSGKWVKRRADALPWNFTVPRRVEWSAPDMKTVSDKYLAFLGWYYNGGCIIKNRLAIPNTRDEGITDILNALGYKFGKNGDQWIIYEPELAERLAPYGENRFEKRLPDWVFEMSQRQMRIFLEYFAGADGYRKKPGRQTLYTSSPKLADGLHALAVLAGYSSSQTKRPPKGNKNRTADEHVISLSAGGQRNTRINPDTVKHVDYDGYVYCATVPAGLLLTRREGTVIWSGNSKVADVFYEVREGGMMGGEPMCFDFGNGTRNTGRFFENCAGKYSSQYIVRSIDSREAYRTNKETIQQDVDFYGEDSDYIRTRIRGLFPQKGDLQFMSSEEVEQAMARTIAVNHKSDPLVLGVDVGRFGDDDSVIFPRIGYDCRSFEPRTFSKMDGEQLANEVVQYINEFALIGVKCQNVYVDEGGGYGGSVIDNLRRMGIRVTPVQPGETAVKKNRYALRIDEMWGGIRDNLKHLMLPSRQTRHGAKLYEQLTQREYYETLKGQDRLEPKPGFKARMGESPDLADALALTFADPVFTGMDTGGQAAYINLGGEEVRYG